MYINLFTTSETRVCFIKKINHTRHIIKYIYRDIYIFYFEIILIFLYYFVLICSECNFDI